MLRVTTSIVCWSGSVGLNSTISVPAYRVGGSVLFTATKAPPGVIVSSTSAAFALGQSMASQSWAGSTCSASSIFRRLLPSPAGRRS
jgi:hypothetical protein